MVCCAAVEVVVTRGGGAGAVCEYGLKMMFEGICMSKPTRYTVFDSSGTCFVRSLEFLQLHPLDQRFLCGTTRTSGVAQRVATSLRSPATAAQTCHSAVFMEVVQ